MSSGGKNSGSNRSGNEPRSCLQTAFTGFSFYNWINLLAYVANIVITYGFGNAGWANRPTNGELSDKYQTIVTPNSKAFLIWTLIFLIQAIWVVWQIVVPSQRQHPCVIDGVRLKYVLISLFQICWTFSFTWEVIWLSLVFMLLLCASLLWTVSALNALPKSFLGWLVWQFPFSLHCGWILAASAVNVNVTLVTYGASTTSQIGVAGASLLVLFLVCLGFLWQFPVDLAPPCVIAWALGWIYYELKDPLESILQRFTDQQIHSFQLSAIVGTGVILGLVLAKAIYVLMVQRKQHQQGAGSTAIDAANDAAQKHSKEQATDNV